MTASTAPKQIRVGGISNTGISQRRAVPKHRPVSVVLSGVRVVSGSWLLQAVTDEDGTIVVSDSYGIAWGHGDSVDRAVADWQTAAREILEMLDHEPHLSDALVARQEILRSWIR